MMSDSSNDDSKDFNSSEVSSTCNVGRQNQPAEEGASTSDAPVARSLSPDTSDAVATVDNQTPDLTSTTNEQREEDSKSNSSEEYLDAHVSGNVTGSNVWTAEQPPASSSRAQQEGQAAVSEGTSKAWQMLMSYDSTSEDDEEDIQPASASESVETREISTTQQQSADVSPNNGQNVSGSGDAVRDEGASSSEMRLEGSSVSGSHEFNPEVEAGSSSNVEEISEGLEEQLTSSENNNDGVESSRLNQPELEAEEEEEEEMLISSGHEAEASVDEEPVAVSGSDDLQPEPQAEIMSSSSNNIIASLLTAERPASSEADPLAQPQVQVVRPDSPSMGRLRPEGQIGGSRALDIPVAPSVANESRSVAEEAARRVTSGSQRPLPGESVLAQQLRVSSAGLGHSALMRQLISSHTEPAVANRCGPDSTTVDQSAISGAEEVSTTEEDQTGQVSTSQQRGNVSTSWPAASGAGVSSSVDIPISTSNTLSGLLASRLSRDPLVSTSNSMPHRQRENDVRDSSGASSTTSGLRGLLSTPARATHTFARSNFSPPTQSISPPSLPEPTDNAMSGHQPEAGSSFLLSPQMSPSSSQKPAETPHSFLAMQLAGPSMATAPGDKFPGDDKGKKRKASPDRPPRRSPPPPSPGPSRDANHIAPPNASLMEQLRKAGVIITAVPSGQGNAPETEPAEPEMRPPFQVDVQISQPSTSRQPEPVVIDSNSCEDFQGAFESKEGTEDEEGQMVLVDEDMPAPDVPEKKKPGRKRGKRKPVDLNPELLRPKRPRRAKEKHEEEEKAKEAAKKVELPPPTPPDGETPIKKKRGRKPKALLLQLAAEAKAREEALAQERELKGEEAGSEETQEQSSSSPPPEKKKEKRQYRKRESTKAEPKKTPKTPKQRTPKPKPVRETPNGPQDEETRMSATAEDSQQGKLTDSAPRKRFVLPILQPLEVTADDVAEYQWPPNDRLADTYMLQEQIALFLGVKSFKRKYPELKRRPVEPQEREFLQEKGIVSESMCDLGLTAVLSAEVLDIMSADYHEKYEEYKRAVRERHAKEMQNKAKSMSVFKPMDAKTRAMQSAAKWNASFNKERREERRCCCDLQTMTFHFPEQKRKTVMNNAKPAPGTYPVALIPGQYTDYYKDYSANELKYLPVNTVMYGPLRPNEQLEEKMSEGSQSDSEGSSSSDDSSSDTSSEGSADSADSLSTAPEADQENIANAPPAGTKCRTCSFPGQPDNMITCSQCNTHGHLLCLGLSTDMLIHIRRYMWQCTDCKTCIQCKDPADEDKMLFCDLCDRGYHIYCVGLRKVPEGRWHCKVCAICGSCGSIDPSGTEAPPQPMPPNSPEKAPQWQHEFKKGDKNSKVYAQTLCVPCSRLWKKGSYCQHCSRCYSKTDSTTMVNCSICDKWMHAECCKLAPGPELAKLNFVCDNCQEGSQVRATPSNKGFLKVVGKVH
ncbi:proteoglycan 4 isoform X1 [Cloeon dipterum]|uniref:proteoglycan 4 isoform X1 n=1 Tax=Cloeon dipterum TaxID=197152 RepID=UPI0032208C47